ncbi:Carbohydrate esterase family 9 protein [Mycena chlorophos]|uniref:Carbohydrate esterase family 9 protein n=1 Tax=Mycena chlorophos TaxID=658473 RepID=A0A8H6TJA0_MYCCL|nr:Carbohydrate esterase family 9 protein [Mycena chlorophos]
MTLKHTRTPSPDPPRKRPHLLLPPSPSFDDSTSHPIDSPRNPFGRSFAWRKLQDLPAATRLDQHLALRFQYVRRGQKQVHWPSTDGGVYRVVHVPQNYTLCHLRTLIWWLFGGQVGVQPPDPQDTTAHLHPNLDADVPLGHNEAPYHFEVKQGVTMYMAASRPGQIKTGTTWAVASGVLDPYLYEPNKDNSADEDPEEELAAEEDAVAEIEQDSRPWLAEEDVSMAHVWPDGPESDASRGIIYVSGFQNFDCLLTWSQHHNPLLQIHITINTLPVPERKLHKKSHNPFVLKAAGNTYLDPPFNSRTKRLAPVDPDLVFSDEALAVWNEEDAFSDYYNVNTILPLTTYQQEEAELTKEDQEAADRERGMFSSSPVRPSSVMGSDPFISLSPARRTPLVTPAPKPAQRKRLMHMQRRLRTQSRSLGKDSKEAKKGSGWRDERESEKVDKRQRALERALEAQIEWSLEASGSSVLSPEI